MGEALPISRAYPAPGILVERTENSVAISGTMEMYGPEANAARAASVEFWINKTWTKSFPDGSSVKCNIHVRLQGPGSAGTPAAQIHADRTWRPSETSRWDGSMLLNANESDAFTWTAAHEFGHVIGLDDRYKEGFFSRLGSLVGRQRTSTVERGYEHNLMAVPNGDLEGRNLSDLASETAPSPHWINDDTQVRNWLNAHSDSDLANLSSRSKIKAIKTLMGGYISDADMAAIVRICNSAVSRGEADMMRNEIDPYGFHSIRQRTELRVVFAMMKYQVFKGEPPSVGPTYPIRSLVAPKASETVKASPGDTLSALAAKYYGAEDYWPLIWDSNRASIGSNPNSIKPGTVLRLPSMESLSAAQRENAKGRHASWKRFPHGPKQGQVPLAPLR